MSGTLEPFLTDLVRGLGKTMVSVNKELTVRSRIKRSWSMRQCAQFLNMSIPSLGKYARDHDDFPKGEYVGRERLFTLEDLMHIRALIAAEARNPYECLAWRKPGDELPVISFASQKGGTAKSLSAAHFAQYLSLHYGMRVGVMDADPQSTITLYFVGGEEMPQLPDEETTATMVNFAGVEALDAKTPYTDHDAATLDSFFLKTAWPGLRIVPATSATSSGDLEITRLMSHNLKNKAFYRYLRDSVERWSAEYVPMTSPQVLAKNGVVNQPKLAAALGETLDCIIIDFQPALTLFQLNSVVASTHVVIPQTMKGFDIATLASFVSGLRGMLDHILEFESMDIGTGSHMLLPTIVQRANEQDLRQIENLLEHCPNDVLPVYYLRSDSISNAADLYQSAYEYEPDTKGKRKGIERFISNANAVNDAIVSRIWPHLSRGYAQQWIDDFYEDEDDQGAGA